MGIEFNYAQARAQARQGQRLSGNDWRALEAADSLAQYLHGLRGTTLAPWVQHFTATTSPHVITRSLRGEWRHAVDEAVRWTPPRWRESVRWLAQWTTLPFADYLANGGAAWPWMADDPVLAPLIGLARDEQHKMPGNAGVSAEPARDANPYEAWNLHWQALWPVPPGDEPGLVELASLLRNCRDRPGDEPKRNAARPEPRAQLSRRALRMLHRRPGEAVVIFVHLLLTALDLERLRHGLLRRALFNDQLAEHAS